MKDDELEENATTILQRIFSCKHTFVNHNDNFQNSWIPDNILSKSVQQIYKCQYQKELTTIVLPTFRKLRTRVLPTPNKIAAMKRRMTVDDGYVDDDIDHVATQLVRIVHGL